MGPRRECATSPKVTKGVYGVTRSKGRCPGVGGRARLKFPAMSALEREQALAKERDFFVAVLESADALIFVLDHGGCIVHANHTAQAATRYRADDLRGRPFSCLLPIGEPAAAFDEALRCLSEGAAGSPFEGHWLTSTGERLLVAGSLSPLRDDRGVLSHVVVTATDITERRAFEDKLRVLSLRDDLTGLYNRRGFSLLAEQRLKDSRRSASSLTLVYADVDHLKLINDSFGHHAGDVALGLCAKALTAIFRESDVVARIGGDEFVVLAEDDARGLDVLAMLVKRQLARRAVPADLAFPLAMTLGTTRSQPPHSLSLDELLQRADQLMYQRKRRVTRRSA